MADQRYSIDWAPPDIGPGAAFIASILNQNRASDRADANLEFQRSAHRENMQRESNQLKRQEEADKYRRSVEAFNARPMLERMANRSVSAANANPYGIGFSEGYDIPANVEGPEQSPAAEAARFAPQPAPEQEFHVPPQPPQGTLAAAEEGPELNPAASAARYLLEGPQQAPRVLDPGEEGPQEIQPEALPIQARAAAASMGMPMEPGPMGKRRVYGEFQGARYEVPEQSETTGFGEKYDVIYQRALAEPGVTPEEAYKFVAKMAHDDAAEAGRNTRLAQSISGRNANREDQQAFLQGENAKYRSEGLTFDQRMKLVDEAGKFKVAASAPGLKADAANARDMSLLERAGSAIRQTGQFSKLAASDRTVRGIMSNIASGTVPLQHADAQIQMARFFRQAQPTEGEMHMLYNNLGGTMDKWNQFVARMESGDLSAEQMRQLKVSAKAVQREHAEDIHRFVNVMKARLGPGGGFDLMPDQAQKLYESMGAELGLENLPPLYGVEGGVTLGSGKRPTVQPRGKKRTALDDIEAQLDALGAK
jgi:hypothetical protein